MRCTVVEGWIHVQRSICNSKSMGTELYYLNTASLFIGFSGFSAQPIPGFQGDFKTSVYLKSICYRYFLFISLNNYSNVIKTLCPHLCPLIMTFILIRYSSGENWVFRNSWTILSGKSTGQSKVMSLVSFRNCSMLMDSRETWAWPEVPMVPWTCCCRTSVDLWGSVHFCPYWYWQEQ